MLQIKLNKNYSDFKLNINFKAKKGEITLLTGASGSGKTTTLEAIAGFLELDDCSILFDGNNLGKVEINKRNIITIFQEDNLFSHLNIFENIALGIKPSLKVSNKEKEQIEQAIKTVGLDEVTNIQTKLPEQLSGGQKQRVALARTIVSSQKILLLDEPVSALGPQMRQNILELINNITIQKSLVTILVSHQPAEVKNASKLVLLKNGKVVLEENYNKAMQNISSDLKDYLG